jgi:hypothetical protein
MLNCWHKSPEDRQNFFEICARLTKFLENGNSQYNYVDALNPQIEIEMSEEKEVTV